MREFFRARAPWVALLLVAPLSLGGCLSDDDDTDLLSLIDPETANTVAEGMSTGVVEAMADLWNNLDEWTQELVPPPAGPHRAINWNPKDQMWVIDETETIEDDDSSGTIESVYHVQFLVNGVVQQYFSEEVTRANVTMNREFTVSFTDGGITVGANWEASTSIQVDVQSNGTLLVGGSGNLTGVTTVPVNGVDVNMESDGNWMIDWSMAEGQDCIAGGMTGRVREHDFSATFDSQGDVMLVVMKDGATVHTDTWTHCGGDE